LGAYGGGEALFADWGKGVGKLDKHLNKHGFMLLATVWLKPSL
jgi:hypothetical protein